MTARHLPSHDTLRRAVEHLATLLDRDPGECRVVTAAQVAAERREHR